MITTIPDFTDTEQKLVSKILFERYGKLVPVQLADSELQLDASSEGLTLCPTIYWAERGAHSWCARPHRSASAANFYIQRRSNTAQAMMSTTA
jgi:hypothetical protein